MHALEAAIHRPQEADAARDFGFLHAARRNRLFGRRRHRPRRRVRGVPARIVGAEEAVEESLAREQRAGVDPGFAAGPAFHVGRREQVLSHRRSGDGEGHRLAGLEIELPERADDEIDGRLDENAAIFFRIERVRSEQSVERNLDVVARIAEA